MNPGASRPAVLSRENRVLLQAMERLDERDALPSAREALAAR